MQAKRRSLRIAGLDGDGMQCFSQPLVMRSIMERLKWDKYGADSEEPMLPSANLDLIGGCGVGGLITLMFVKLQMSVDDAIEEVGTVVEEVYMQSLAPKERTSRLKNYVEMLLKKKGFPPDLRLQDRTQDGCAGFVLASLCLNPGVVVCFRTYPVRGEAPSGITVVEAALATCASAEFSPVRLVSGRVLQDYARVNIGANNPIRHVITEAHALFEEGEDTIAIILSLGSGYPRNYIVASDRAKDEQHQPSVETISICQERTQEIQNHLGLSDIYFRFSVEAVMQGSPVLATNLGGISALTTGYLVQPDVKARLDQCVNKIRARNGVSTPKELGHALGLIPSSKGGCMFNRRLPLTDLNQPRPSPASEHSLQPPVSEANTSPGHEETDQVTKVSSKFAPSSSSRSKIGRWGAKLKQRIKFLTANSPSSKRTPPHGPHGPQHFDAASYAPNKKDPPESLGSAGASVLQL